MPDFMEKCEVSELVVWIQEDHRSSWEELTPRLRLSIASPPYDLGFRWAPQAINRVHRVDNPKSFRYKAISGPWRIDSYDR